MGKNEEWRDVVGYEGYYQVSDLGRVRSVPHLTRNNVYGGNRLSAGKVLSVYVMPNGYLQVQFSKGSIREKKYVHRLVAGAFLPVPSGAVEVNHKNGDKTDNRTANLEWITHEKNMRHAVMIGLVRNAWAVRCIETGVVYPSMSDAQRRAGISRHVVKKSLMTGKAYKGRSWELVTLEG